MKRALTALASIAALVAGAAPALVATAQAAEAPARTASIPRAANGAKITKSIRAGVAQLRVANEVRAGYARDKFKHWDDANHDCQNTRSEVLRQESTRRVTGACAVRTGRWRSQYDGAIRYRARQLQIDHLVPLAEAWDSGARSWSAARREAFANDLAEPRSLIAVTASSNLAKGDQDPAEWMPPKGPCKYLAQWVVVKYRWGLTVDPAEKAALTQLAAACPDGRFTTYRAVVRWTAGGGTGGTSGGTGGGTDGSCTPGYSPCLPPASDYDCAGGSGNGPKYVYGTVTVTGSDPYGLDNDGDGLGCE